MRISRRQALKAGAFCMAGAALGKVRAKGVEADSAAKAAIAQAQIWRRFVNSRDVIADYADADGNYPCPTAEECRAGKPNALGWWTPAENGAMFNGMYMDAAVLRWQRTGAAEDREKARRLANGLLNLASFEAPPGFIGRGFATDGKTPYPMGSNDQTGPWLCGVWRCLRAGVVDDARRRQLVSKFMEVARTLESIDWRMPCAFDAPAQFRGTFARFSWEDAPRLLFLAKAAQELSGEARWEDLYRKLLRESGGEESKTRLALCEQGMVFHGSHRASWTGASSVIALRALWEMEQDAALREVYARGLSASARLAAEGLPLCRKFDNASKAVLLHDWRLLNEWWQPQRSEEEAVAVAERQSKELGRLSPRRFPELMYVREPAFAAWVVTMCPDRALVESHRAALLETIGWYDFERLNYSQFFPVEAAWERLQT